MLTGFQVAIGAYVTEDMDLLCEDCYRLEDVYAKPVSNYELDEWQSQEAYDYEWDDDDEAVDHQYCEPELLDVNGHELREAYHEGHEDES